MRRHDDELEADVRRVVAYRAECPCGWRGRSHRTIAAARLEAHEHNRDAE